MDSIAARSDLSIRLKHRLHRRGTGRLLPFKKGLQPALDLSFLIRSVIALGRNGRVTIRFTRPPDTVNLIA